jgi:hypothetical protein
MYATAREMKFEMSSEEGCNSTELQEKKNLKEI